MRLSKTTSYAILALAYLSTRGNEGAIQARQVAQAIDLATDSTLKILQSLSRQGLIQSRLGRGGGYYLTKSAEEIKLLDILQAIEGSLQGYVPIDVNRLREAVNQSANGSAAESTPNSTHNSTPNSTQDHESTANSIAIIEQVETLQAVCDDLTAKLVAELGGVSLADIRDGQSLPCESLPLVKSDAGSREAEEVSAATVLDFCEAV